MLAIYLMAFDNPSDKNRFESLYNQYERLMFYVAYSILGDYHMAEDAVNDAFIKIIDNFDKIGEIDCPHTKRFVVIVTKSVSIDAYRRRRTQNVSYLDVHDNAFDTEEISANESAQDEFFKNAEIDAICEAFGKLAPEQQLALYYHAVLEESVKDTARIMNKKPETVKKSLYRARRALRQMMEISNE